jgi:hypothetical protein
VAIFELIDFDAALVHHANSVPVNCHHRPMSSLLSQPSLPSFRVPAYRPFDQLPRRAAR